MVPESIPVARPSPCPSMGNEVGMGVGFYCLGVGHGIAGGIGRGGGTWECGIASGIGQFGFPHS